MDDILMYISNKNMQIEIFSWKVWIVQVLSQPLKINMSSSTTRVGPDTFWPDIRYPDSFNIRYPAWYLANARYPANYRISGRITGYQAVEINRISGVRIVSISVNRPDIENGRISGPTLSTTQCFWINEKDNVVINLCY